MRPLKLGKLLNHREALVAGTTLDNVKAMAVTKQVPHLRWSQAPPLPWRRPGSADFGCHSTTASEFRAWKSTFLTRAALIDNTGRDIILNWVIEAFEEGRDVSEYADSGLLPRLDSHLGSLLMDSRHLKGELGMKFQSCAQSCQMARRAPRGRAFLYMLAQHFRLGLNRGKNLTQQALLDLQLDGYTGKDLEKFVERIEYVLNAIPQSHQPNEVTGSAWLYSRVKRRKLLQRHIDRIRDASETSHCRTWDWLMNKIKAVLIEVREDQNEESIRASLLTKASKEQKPDRRQPKAAVAGTDEHKGSKAVDTKGIQLQRPSQRQRPSLPRKGTKDPIQRRRLVPKGKTTKTKAKERERRQRILTRRQNPSQQSHACFIQRVIARVGIVAHSFMSQRQLQSQRQQHHLRQLWQQSSVPLVCPEHRRPMLPNVLQMFCLEGL